MSESFGFLHKDLMEDSISASPCTVMISTGSDPAQTAESVVRVRTATLTGTGASFY